MESALARLMITQSADGAQSAALSSSSQQQTVYSSPLDQLHKPLMSLSKAAQQFREVLAAARNITNPWPWEKAHPEKETLIALVTKIDPKKALDDQLENCINVIHEFDKKFHQKLILFFAETDKKNVAAIRTKIAATYQYLLSEFDDYRVKYEKNIEALISYREHVRETKIELNWIVQDIADAKKWIDLASRYNEELKDIEKALVSVKLDIPAGLSAVKKRINDGVDLSAFEQLRQDVSTLLEVINSLMSEKTDGEKIEAHQRELQILECSYAEARREYQSSYDFYASNVSVTGLKHLYGKLGSEIYYCLQEYNKKGKLNEAAILALLKGYLNPDPVRAEVEDKDVKQEINRLLTARDQVTTDFADKLTDLHAKAKQQLDRVQDAKAQVAGLDARYSALALPAESELSISNVLRPGWQEKELQTLRVKLNVDSIRSSQAFFERQFEELQKKERRLLATQERLTQAKQKDEQVITALLTLLLADQQTCQLGNCESWLLERGKDIDEKLAAIKTVVEHYCNVDELINENLTEFKKVMSFTTDESLIFRRRAQDRIAELTKEQDELNEAAPKQLREMKAKWDEKQLHLTEFDEQLKDMQLTVRFPLTVKEFYEAMQRMASPLYSLVVAQPDQPEAMAGVYRITATTYSKLIKKLHKVKLVLQQIAPELFAQSGVAEKKLFQEVNTHIEGMLSASNASARDEQIKLGKKNLQDHFAKVDWQESQICSDDTFAQDLAAPRELKHRLDELIAYESLLSNNVIVEELGAKKDLLEDFVPRFVAYKMALEVWQYNIKVFFERHGSYKERSFFFTKFLAVIGEKHLLLKQKINAVERLLALNVRCQGSIDMIDEAVRSINQSRANLFSTLQTTESELRKNIGELDTALGKIKAEVKFKQDVLLLYANISAVKQRQAAINLDNGELFVRLRREFLFAGKSKAIIAELKAHRQLHHRQTPKGNLIDEFLHGLFDEKNLADLSVLKAYFGSPFGNNTDKNQALFAGLASTTKSLIGKLHSELQIVEARERAGGEGSIVHAIQKDCQAIEREYSDILEKNDIGRASASYQSSNDCDVFITQALAMPQDDATAIKIRQDMMDIQRWAGAENTSVTCRRARMECALAMRQDAANLSALFNQYKFSYSYQALKYHLENVTTRRTADLALLWRSLDQIAFGVGDEDHKYTLLRKCMLRYFNHLRQEDAYSISGFFGRVSRLTRATENFLVNAGNGGLGYQYGDGANEVHHVAEGGIFALRCCMPG